jgi:hypothetical protein
MSAPKRRPRHYRFVQGKVDRLITTKMEIRGQALHLQHRWYGACWFFADGTRVDSEIADAVLQDKRVEAVGDSLLPDLTPGQTWRFIA